VSGRRAVFLDRDGVLDELVPDPQTGVPESPLRVEDVRIVPGAAPAVAALRRAGYVVVCVTNQPAAAKGTASIHDLGLVHTRVMELLADQGARVDDARWCLHHPEGLVEGLRMGCECRKPKPGMLRWAAEDLGVELSASWMIGDTDADVEAGQAVGCRTILVEGPGSAHKRTASTQPEARTPDLASAVGIVVGHGVGLSGGHARGGSEPR
jgi:D-glycero-D-manno-heptose 1,7-bisphosphate phosphatase